MTHTGDNFVKNNFVKSLPGGVSDNFRTQTVFWPVRQKTRLFEAIAEFASFSPGQKTVQKMSVLAGRETFDKSITL